MTQQKHACHLAVRWGKDAVETMVARRLVCQLIVFIKQRVKLSLDRESWGGGLLMQARSQQLQSLLRCHGGRLAPGKPSGG